MSISRVAVLLSGGLDSAVLLADEASRARATDDVHPVYVSTGLAWESAERAIIARLLAAPPLAGRTAPLTSLSVETRDIYASTHWAVAGRPPGYHTPDEDVYLPGRNIILLGKAGVYAAVAQLDRVVLGSLGHNPFPDATPQFRSAMARALSLGLARDLQLEAPYAEMSKAQVIRRGVELGVPFEFSLSCMSPVGAADADRGGGLALHCGTCSKCRERHDAFVEAGLPDPTTYADERFVHASGA